MATADLGEPVSLSRLASFPDIAYDPSRYSCAYYKDGSMEAKVSIFAFGKMIAVGAKNEASAKRDLKHVAMSITKQGFVSSRRMRITVRNVGMSAFIRDTLREGCSDSIIEKTCQPIGHMPICSSVRGSFINTRVLRQNTP